MVPVLGGADEVVAHLLLFPPVGGVLGTVGLIIDTKKRGGRVESYICLVLIHQEMCGTAVIASENVSLE